MQEQKHWDKTQQLVSIFVEEALDLAKRQLIRDEVQLATLLDGLYKKHGMSTYISKHRPAPRQSVLKETNWVIVDRKIAVLVLCTRESIVNYRDFMKDECRRLFKIDPIEVVIALNFYPNAKKTVIREQYENGG